MSPRFTNEFITAIPESFTTVDVIKEIEPNNGLDVTMTRIINV